MSLQRKIIHCDCDCFYAAIEMRDNPELVGKPLAVGGSPKRRGVVATCNYEARKFGVHSAMAAATARRRCPQLIILRPAMDKYRVASQQIHEIFQHYTAIIEPLSLDEAYLDVTECTAFQGSATRIAQAIRRAVREQVGITISAGIAPNKFLAKIASDWHKPDGQLVIKPDQVAAFVAKLPVKKLPGVGRVTAARMHKLGLHTCADLARLTEAELTARFGSFGVRLGQLSRGLDNRPVETARIRKSLSVENTYAEDLPDLAHCLQQIPPLWQLLAARLGRVEADYTIHKQFVKIKFQDFVTTTAEMVCTQVELANYRALMTDGFARGNKPVRLLGLGVRVQPAGEQVGGHGLAYGTMLAMSHNIPGPPTKTGYACFDSPSRGE